MAVLIMGIGNYLMGDEGVGVHAAQRLAKETLPEGIDVLDGGTGGFFLMEYFENYPVVILIDATLDDRPTGSIRVIEPRFASDFPRAMSTHDIGLRDLVEGLAILGKLPKIYLFAVSIEMIQSQQIELSPELERVMPELLEQVKNMALRQNLELV
ncbi:MAG: hydrogenase maturation protease [Haliscomenobacter sp.]|uniref:hydrogenase maturation protease n=1 Tax=Haliscomenobacter sp. TaxID=2717303 RepID=UPI0029B4BB4D|nr:hydrogenase maturation protease [Haliscomenobacter sp.]MDX2068516.1 hydrogenase maturation protease [Haliscomenobacter sp.]